MYPKKITDKKSIAICGTRGIPANYGGFETFAQELATRLVHTDIDEVRVYCRKSYDKLGKKKYKGVRRVVLWAPKNKYLETPLHALFTILHLLIQPVSFVVFCNGANAPFLWLLKLRGIRCALNVDGIERNRQKWGLVGKLWYRLGEVSTRYFPDVVVSDADVIRNYYLDEHGLESQVIPYGYNSSRDGDVAARLRGERLDSVSSTLNTFGLEEGNFTLFVSRLEPENNAHTVIGAHLRSKENLPKLVIVGWAPYAQRYIQSLKDMADDSVIFTGFQFGAVYQDLQLAAGLYIQATEVGGTHPALVEAMGFGQAIIVNDTPENREVVGDTALVYPKNSVSELSKLMVELYEAPEKADSLRKAARARVETKYSWRSVTEKYRHLMCI